MQILKRGIFLSIFLLSASCVNQITSDDKIITNDTDKNGIKYVDVTKISRKTLNDHYLLGSDNLHPNGLMYL